MNANKIDVSTVCEMFEKLSEKLDKQTTDKSAEPLQAIEKFSEPTKVEHRHTIDIASSKVFRRASTPSTVGFDFIESRKDSIASGSLPSTFNIRPRCNSP